MRFVFVCAFLLFFLPATASGQESSPLERALQDYQLAVDAGDEVEALRVAKKAYSLGDQEYGRKSAEMAQLAFNLGTSLRNLGQAQTAVVMLNRSLSESSRVYGKMSFRNVPVLKELAQARADYTEEYRSEQNNPMSAGYYYELDSFKYLLRALAIEKKAHGRNDLKYIKAAQKLAKSALDSGHRDKIKRSGRLIKMVYKYHKDTRANDWPTLIELGIYYGRYFLETGKLKRSAAQFAGALAIINEAGEDFDEFERVIRRHLAGIYLALGDDDLASDQMVAFGDLTQDELDADYVVLISVNPVFPDYAMRALISGYVELEFTINELGGVEDIEVLRSEPVGIFEKAAIRAVEQHRYFPRIEGGMFVPTYGVTNLLTFESSQN